MQRLRQRGISYRDMPGEKMSVMDGSYKYRVKYTKTGCMKYLGHLDVLRYFQKAIKRSGLPIAYSEGFNPHQLLSFAAPLSVGVESVGEYFDMELLEEIPKESIVEALGAAMVEGISVADASYLPGKTVNAMAAVTAASYSVYMENAADFVSFIQESERIMITKKTKKSEREIDLKPLIYECRLLSDKELSEDAAAFELTDTQGLRMVLPCGSTENIKPQLVTDAYRDAFDREKAAAIRLYRRDLFLGVYPDIRPLL